MAKQLNVNVAVTADTSQAKAQLQQLQTTLSQLSSSPTNLHLGLNTSELTKAISDIDKLQVHLKNATSANGTLDFGKLNTSITQSGSSLKEYGSQLLKLGPQGQQAFNQLTQAVAKSEIPINRMKGLLGEFGTVLGNTIKWQAASSAIHGMMGSIQHAFSYAQDLNESLNKIQIVTQQSDAQMAKFAESANKAAKALSTTTTSYTDASLIYYQQGLSDQEVAKRTEVTIKMANAAGVSAKTVSDQMTAVWNNFADGSKSLEYYADVMTALGAATASSTDEISKGLEKFASVADTVGLSYENAAAALATITATTRQSADSVGTGLRTLFSRLESVKLGETLEDGVGLTKYSEALQSVGVNILDANGELKRMDTILEDLGERWQGLNDTQKTALAQTVGGVRQYTTLIALMDNFDFYKRNQQTALNSAGTVQAQADIYAKSWEAAQKRVKAASEALYSDLIDDKFFIALNDGFAGFLEVLDKIIDGFGGLKTLIPMVGAALTGLFSQQISSGMVNFANALVTLKPGYAKQQANERNQFLISAGQQMIGVTPGTKMTEAQKQQVSWARADLSFQQNYARNASAMTAFDRQLAQKSMDKFTNLRLQQIEAAQRVAESQYKVTEARGTLAGVNATNMNTYINSRDLDDKTRRGYMAAQEYELQSQFGRAGYFTGSASRAGDWYATNGTFLRTTYSNALEDSKDIDTLTNLVNREASLRQIFNNLKQTGTQGLTSAGRDLAHAGFSKDQISDFMSQIYDRGSKQLNTGAIDSIIINSSKEQEAIINEFTTKWNMNAEAVRDYAAAIVAANGDIEKEKELVEQIKQARKETEQNTKANKQLQVAQQITKYAQAMQGAVAAGNAFAAATGNIVNNIQNGDSAFANFGQTLSGVTSGVMSAVMVMNAIPGTFGAIIAVVSTLIGVFSQIPYFQDLFSKLFKTDFEIEISKTEKLINTLETSLEEAKQKSEDFLNASNTHNSLLEQINQLTVGTNEFKNAVIEANAYAKNMMGTYGLSLDSIYKDENGLINFKPGVLEQTQLELNSQRDNLEMVTGYMNDYYLPQLNWQNSQSNVQWLLDQWVNGYTLSEEPTGKNWITGKPTYDKIHESGSLQSYIDKYNEDENKALYDSFETFLESRNIHTDNGFYKQFKDRVTNELGYESVDQFIEEQNLYGTLGQQSFKNIASKYFENLALSEIVSGGKDIDISKFVAKYLGNNEEIGKEIESAENVSKLTGNELEKTLEEKLGKDVVEKAKKENQDLTALAKAYDTQEAAKEKFNEIYDRYVEVDKDLRAKTIDFAKSRNQDAENLSELNQVDQQYFIEQLEKQLPTDQTSLEYSIYKDYIDRYKQQKEDIATQLVGILGSKDWDSGQIDAAKDTLLKQLSTFKVTDEELNKIINLQSSLKNTFGKQFNADFFYRLFDQDGNLNQNLMQAWQSVDFSNKISTLFSMKHAASHMTKDNPLKDYFNYWYNQLGDIIGGKSGIFAEIFQEEDFQKALKKAQREIKKTGEVSEDVLESLIESSDNLTEALDENIYSAGAVGDAIELYSMGAVDSIDAISDELWEALGAANAFSDALRTAFNFIDNWNPDRSIIDIGDFFSKVSKDYFDELENGTTGSERLYQDAGVLFGQTYAKNLRNWFYNEEYDYADNPEKRSADYTTTFSKFDEVYKQVQKDGSMQAYWNFLLNSDNQAAIDRYMGITDAVTALNGIGITGGSGKDIEVAAKGRTTNEFINDIAKTLGLDTEVAAMLATELSGHGPAATDLKTNDFLYGYKIADKKGQTDEYIKSQQQELETIDFETMKNSLARQAKAAGYGDNDLFDLTTEYGKQYQLLMQMQKEYEQIKIQQEKIKEAEELSAIATGDKTSATKTQEQALEEINQLMAENKQNATKTITNENGEDQQVVDVLELMKANEELGISNEATMEALEKSGDTLGTTWTDSAGEVHTAIKKEDETLEQFQQKVSETQQQIEDDITKTKKSAADRQMGKDIFSGILEAFSDFNKEDFDESTLEIITAVGNLSQAIAEFANGNTEDAGEKLREAFEAFSQLDGIDLPEGFGDSAVNLIQAIKDYKVDDVKSIETLKSAISNFATLNGITLPEGFMGTAIGLVNAIKAYDGTPEKAAALNSAIAKFADLDGINLPEGFSDAAVELVKALSEYDGSPMSVAALNMALARFASLGTASIPEGFAAAAQNLINAIKDYKGTPEDAEALNQALSAFLALNNITLPEGFSDSAAKLIGAIKDFDNTEDKTKALQTALSEFATLNGITLPEGFMGAAVDLVNAIKAYDGTPEKAAALNSAIAKFADLDGINLPEGFSDAAVELIKAISTYDGSPISVAALGLALSKFGSLNNVSIPEGFAKNVSDLIEAIKGYKGTPEDAEALKQVLTAFAEANNIKLSEAQAKGAIDLIDAIKNYQEEDSDSVENLKSAIQEFAKLNGVELPTGDTISAIIRLIRAIQTYDGKPESIATLNSAIAELVSLDGINLPENLGSTISTIISAIASYDKDDPTSIENLKTAINSFASLKGITLPNGFADAVGDIITAIKDYDNTDETTVENLKKSVRAFTGLTGIKIDDNFASGIQGIIDAINTYEGPEDASSLTEAITAFANASNIDLPEGLSEEITSLVGSLKLSMSGEQSAQFKTALTNISDAFGVFKDTGDTGTLVTALQTNLPTIIGLLTSTGSQTYTGPYLMQAAMQTLAAALGMTIEDNVSQSLSDAIDTVDTVVDKADEKASKISEIAGKLKQALQELWEAFQNYGMDSEGHLDWRLDPFQNPDLWLSNNTSNGQRTATFLDRGNQQEDGYDYQQFRNKFENSYQNLTNGNIDNLAQKYAAYNGIDLSKAGGVEQLRQAMSAALSTTPIELSTTSQQGIGQAVHDEADNNSNTTNNSSQSNVGVSSSNNGTNTVLDSITQVLDILNQIESNTAMSKLEKEAGAAASQLNTAKGALKDMATYIGELGNSAEKLDMQPFTGPILEATTTLQTFIDLFQGKQQEGEGQQGSQQEPIPIPVTYVASGKQDEPEDKEAAVRYTPIAFQQPPEEQWAAVNYSLGTQAPPHNKTAEVYYTYGGQDPPQKRSAGMNNIGFFVTEDAAGNNNAKGFGGGYHSNSDYQGLATVGELGPELMIHGNQAYLVGIHGRTTTFVQKGDQIYTAAQTQKIMENNPPMRDIPGFAGGDGTGGSSYGHYGPNAGGSGGGGGGSSRGGAGTKTKDFDPERYHVLTKQIELVTDAISDLTDALNGAFGKQQLELIAEQMEETQRLIQKYDELNAEARVYEQEDIKALIDAGVWENVVLDDKGYVANYDELQNMYARAAAEIDTSELKGDEKEEAERYKKELQTDWELIKKYEETHDKIRQAERDRDKQARELLSLMKKQAEIQVKLDIAYDERKVKQLDNYISHWEKLADHSAGLNKVMKIFESSLATMEKRDLAQDALDRAYAKREEKIKELADLGLSGVVQYDRYGHISNLNDIKEQYNIEGMSREKMNALTPEQRQMYNDITRIVEYLEKNEDEMEELKETIEDAAYAIAENTLKQIQAEINAKLEVNDDQIKFLDHLLNKVNDDIYKSADAFAIVNKKMAVYGRQIQDYNTGIHKILTQGHTEDGTAIAALPQFAGMSETQIANKIMSMSAKELADLKIDANDVEQLHDYADGLLETLEAMEELEMFGVEKFKQAFDELNEKVKESLGLFDHFEKLLTGLKDVADLQGFGYSQEIQDTIYGLNESLLRNTENTVKAYQEHYKGLKETRDQLKEYLDDPTAKMTENHRKDLEQQLKDIEKQMREEQEKVLDLWREGLQIAKEMFEQEMEEIRRSFEREIAGVYTTLDGLQEAFDRSENLDEQYVDDYEKLYQLSKLQRTLTRDIDERAKNGLKNNKNLQALLNEIEDIRASGAEMSQYELDILQKRYEYEKALAELEDQRTAKMTVRLQRDRNGNWGYVYTALEDEEELQKREQEVEDKLHDWQQTAVEQNHQLQADQLALNTEVSRRLMEIYQDDSLTEEERQRAINDLNEWYQERSSYLNEQMNLTMRDAGDTLEIAKQRYNDVTFDILDRFSETSLGAVTAAASVNDLTAQVTIAMTRMELSSDQAIQKYNDYVEAFNHLVQQSNEDFTTFAAQSMTTINQLSTQQIQVVKDDVNEMCDVLWRGDNNIMDMMKDFNAMYAEMVEGIMKTTEALVARLYDMNAGLKGIVDGRDDLASFYNSLDSTKGVDARNVKPTVDQKEYGNLVENMYAQNGFVGQDGRKKLVVDADTYSKLMEAKTMVDFYKDQGYDIIKGDQAQNVLDGGVKLLSQGLGDFQINDGFANNTENPSNIGTFTQYVTISAEFPGVTESIQIIEAIQGLENKAVQYANRKN